MINHLTSQQLLSRTQALVHEERKATVALIEHFEEIERRLLYVELGYTSLWDMATRYFGMSEGSAQRRIQAMRLVKAAPEVKKAIEEGALSLSNAAKLQGFCQQEKKGRKPDVKALAKKVESMSQKDCEKTLLAISPQALPRVGKRIVSTEEDRELKFLVSAEVYRKLERIKGLLAHAKPRATYAELMEYMVDEVLSMLEKKKGIRSKTGAAQTVVLSSKLGGNDASTPPTAAAAVKMRTLSPHSLPPGIRVHLPIALQREVWARSGGQCEVVHRGVRCLSTYALDIDHIIPLALRGANEVDNLRIACRPCNRQQARELGIPA